MIAPVPQLWDGGYWQLVPAKSVEGEDGLTVPIPGSWAASYVTLGSDVYGLVRTVAPALPAADWLPVDEASINKVRARVEGR